MNSKQKELFSIMEHSPVVIILWQNKENWPVELISSNVSTLLGYRSEEFLNNSVLYTQIIHPDDMQRVSEEVKENSENGNLSFLHKPYRIITKNGRIKWIRDQTIIRRNIDKKISHYEGIIQDITELKQAESKLKEYFHAVESSPAAIIITNPEGIIEYVNPKFSDITEYSSEEVIGRNMNLVNSGMQDNSFYKDLWDTINSGREWKGVFCNKKKNGGIFWEKTSISSIKDQNNKIIHFIGLKEDITLQKEKEELEKKNLHQRLKYKSTLLQFSQMQFEDASALTEAVSETIFVFLKTDRVGIWKLVNDGTALEPLAMYPEDQKVKRGVINVSKYHSFFNILNLNVSINTNNIGENKTFEKLIEDRVILADSTAALILPLFLAGKLFGMISIQHNGKVGKWTDEEQSFVTGMGSILLTGLISFERNKTEKKLIAAVKEAKRANSVKSEFLANMSHEIRTPMNAILGFSQILMGRMKDVENREFVNSINSSGKHLLSLINDILDLSKVEAGKTDIIYKPCNYPSLIKNIEKMFLHKLIKTEVTLGINLSPEIPESLLLDEDRLTQVLTNLVGNAVKFTKTGSIKISSYFSYHDKNDGSISLFIDIDDTGVGIPEHEWENVFKPFDQTREGTKAEYKGTGLGLAISRKLIDLMNGDIHIVGKDGPGTLVRLTLNTVEIDRSTNSHKVTPTAEAELQETNTVIKSSVDRSLSKTETVKILQLIQILKDGHTKTCTTLIKKLSMQQAKKFVEDINNLGKEYNLPVVINWANTLSKAVISFNKENILEALKTFPDLILQIEKLKD